MTDETGREEAAEESERTDVESYQEELSETVGSGGGCVEAWKATQESRTGNRRSFMTGVVASLFTGASIANVSAAEDLSTDPEKETVELTASETKRLVAEAQSDERVREIRKKLVSRGLKPDRQSVVGYETTYQDREWKFVRIPFSAENSDTLRLDDDGDVVETGAIVWNTASEIEPHGYVTTREVDYDADPAVVEAELREIGADIDSIETVPVVIDHTNFSSGTRSSVEEETNSIAFPVATGRNVSTQGCECNSALANPLTACAPCGIPDTDCIADLANVYAVEVATCGTCVASSGWLTAACATCLAALIEEDDLGFFCCPCEACDGIIIC